MHYIKLRHLFVLYAHTAKYTQKSEQKYRSPFSLFTKQKKNNCLLSTELVNWNDFFCASHYFVYLHIQQLLFTFVDKNIFVVMFIHFHCHFRINRNNGMHTLVVCQQLIVARWRSSTLLCNVINHFDSNFSLLSDCRILCVFPCPRRVNKSIEDIELVIICFKLPASANIMRSVYHVSAKRS